MNKTITGKDLVVGDEFNLTEDLVYGNHVWFRVIDIIQNNNSLDILALIIETDLNDISPGNESWWLDLDQDESVIVRVFE